MSLADSLFTELKRRNVFKIGIAYLVLAWVVIQVTQAAVPAFNMPAWVNTVVFFFGVIGFPFVIFFSWMFEITPDGIKKESEISPEDSITAHTGRKLDFIIIGLLIAGMSYFIWESRFAFEIQSETITDNSKEASSELGSENEEQQTEGASIAVLPFVNMSDDKSNEYFSDGISEEILNVLAKIPKLHVTSRSSAFSFKGKDIIISEVAKKLGVKHILEGSVRKDGNKIRITAQLIEAESDKHLWSETYDRELVDVFTIQDEIANSIVIALKSKLGLETQSIKRSTINIDTYNEYLIGKQRQAKQTKDDITAAIEIFNKVLESEPDYIPSKLSLVLASLQLERFTEKYDERVNIEKDNDLLIKKQLLSTSNDYSDLDEFNGVLGRYYLKRFNYKLAKKYIDTAIALNKNYAQAYLWRADIHYENSDFLAMLKDRETAYKLDPMSLEISRNLAYDYRSFWRPDDAERVIDRMFSLHPDHPDAYMASASNQAAHGRYAEMTVTLEKALLIHPDNKVFKNWLAFGYVRLDQRDAAKKMDVGWTDYEFSRRDKNNELSMDLMKLGMEKDGRAEWLGEATDLYMELGDVYQLKIVLEERIKNFDNRNFPWQDRCFAYMIEGLKMTSMSDSVDSMMKKCSEETEQRLKSGYLCPCSWFNLVAFAILDKRYDDAIKRAEEWLDSGDSYHRLDTDFLFSKLIDKPQYSELLKRNEQQLERQIRIYKNLTLSSKASETD